MPGIDLKSLKSAEEVTDFEAVVARFRKAREEKAVSSAHSTYAINKEGQLEVHKASGLVSRKIINMPPTPEGDALKVLAQRRGLDPKEWGKELATRCIPYIASDERVDGHGDIVKQDWNFRDYESNPVLCDSHNWWMPPVGNALDWQVFDRTEAKYSGPALWILGLFATKEMYEWGDSIFRLVDSGLLRAASVGFYSTKVIDIKDQDERATLGLGRYGYVLAGNFLLELSPTTIGANPGAHRLALGIEPALLYQARRKNLVQGKDIDMLREIGRRDAKRSEMNNDQWKDADSKILIMAKSMFKGFDFIEHQDIDAPFEPSENTKLADLFGIPKSNDTNDGDGGDADPDDKDNAGDETLASVLAELRAMRAELNDKILSVETIATDSRTMLESIASNYDHVSEETEVNNLNNSGNGKVSSSDDDESIAARMLSLADRIPA